MFCKNCGTSLKDGAAFCPECGAKVAVMIEPKQTSEPDLPEQEQPKTAAPETHYYNKTEAANEHPAQTTQAYERTAQTTQAYERPAQTTQNDGRPTRPTRDNDRPTRPTRDNERPTRPTRDSQPSRKQVSERPASEPPRPQRNTSNNRNTNSKKSEGSNKSLIILIIVAIAAAAVAVALFLFLFVFKGNNNSASENIIVPTQTVASADASASSTAELTPANTITAAPTETATATPTATPTPTKEAMTIPTSTPTATATPTATPTAAAKIGNYKVINSTTDPLTLRSEPSTHSTALATLYTDTVVEVIQFGCNGFWKVTYNGQTGYLLPSFLEAVDNAQAPTSTKTYTIITDYVTLRDIPSTEGEAITTINTNEKVEYYDTAQDGFILVKYNGRFGYILTSYNGETLVQ